MKGCGKKFISFCEEIPKREHISALPEDISMLMIIHQPDYNNVNPCWTKWQKKDASDMLGKYKLNKTQ